MATVIPFPAKCNGRTPSAALAEAFRAELEERVGVDASFADRESAGLALANELCAQDQAAHLNRVAARYDAERLQIDGVACRRHSEGTVVVHGLCGPLRVRRWLYRMEGVHNGPTVAPVDLVAGLVERATPALAESVTLGYALTDSREYHKQLDAGHRVLPSRSTTERIAAAVATRMSKHVERVEHVVRVAETLPENVTGIAVGLDRTSAPMEEAREPGDTRPSPLRPRATPYERKKPDAIEVNYRMAYVGTVALVDPTGTALVIYRYGCGAHDDPAAILDRMMADLAHVLAQRPKLPIGVVQDGAPEMWKLVRAALARAGLLEGRHILEAIDKHHLFERLADVLEVVKMPSKKRERILAEWRIALDTDPSAIDVIEKFVIAAHEKHLRSARRKLYEHRTYIENNKHRMRYAELVERGLPIGSGPTEGACKSLVMTRAKSCSQRWSQGGLSNVLVLRALEQSGRLVPALHVLRDIYAADVRRMAA
jgi:hypothetical protein